MIEGVEEGTPISLDEFIAAIRAGKVIVRGAKVVGDTYATIMKPLTLDDPEGVTAEAFSHNVFDYQTVEWDDALAQVEEAIG